MVAPKEESVSLGAPVSVDSFPSDTKMKLLVSLQRQSKDIADKAQEKLERVKSKHGDGARLLVAIPERHDDETQASRIISENIAVDVALSNHPNNSTHLFLETNKIEEGVLESKSGLFDCSGVHSEKIVTVSYPLSVVRASLLIARAASAKLDINFPQKVSWKEELTVIAKMHAAHLRKPVSEDILIEALVQNFIHTIQKPGFTTTPELAVEAAIEAFRINQPAIGNKLIGILTQTIDKIADQSIVDYLDLVKQAEEDLRVEISGFAPQDVRKLGMLIKENRIFAAVTLDDQLGKSIQNGRELIMAFAVGRRRFDIGVLNCGSNHAASENLKTFLKQKNIHLWRIWED